MATEKTGLQKRIESGKTILLAEMCPPQGGNPEPVRAAAKRYAGRVHALGVSDNRDGVHMSAMAAAALVASEGVEPILHITTRDRNRMALAADGLGAQAMGVRNVLCTTGGHQGLGSCHNSRNVFDLDSIQLLAMYNGMAGDGSLVGEERFDGIGSFCLGCTASPYADPLEMQVIRLAKAVTAGARFVITQPVFDVSRFEQWWSEVTGRGLHEKAAIIAGIEPLTSADSAKALAGRRPSPMIPDSILQRLESAGGASAQRTAGIEIAVETIQRLSSLKGLRGFEIHGPDDPDTTLALIEKSGLGVN